jgi:hypothetical protein
VRVLVKVWQNIPFGHIIFPGPQRHVAFVCCSISQGGGAFGAAFGLTPFASTSQSTWQLQATLRRNADRHVIAIGAADRECERKRVPPGPRQLFKLSYSFEVPHKTSRTFTVIRPYPIPVSNFAADYWPDSSS